MLFACVVVALSLSYFDDLWQVVKYPRKALTETCLGQSVGFMLRPSYGGVKGPWTCNQKPCVLIQTVYLVNSNILGLPVNYSESRFPV